MAGPRTPIEVSFILAVLIEESTWANFLLILAGLINLFLIKQSTTGCANIGANVTFLIDETSVESRLEGLRVFANEFIEAFVEHTRIVLS